MSPHVVLADDLTGACEAAGFGHERGRHAEVLLVPEAGAPPAEGLRVFSTETRLLTPSAAARRVREFASVLPRGTGVFKKTDSVLRGPVVAELAAAADALGLRRVLLVAANPALQREVVQGRYRVGGVPLHHTPFAQDPHHPARTDHVGRLIGPWPGAGSTVIADPGMPLPTEGLVVGSASSARDLARWARSVKDDVLPAGSAAFLAACLPARGRRAAPPVPALPVGRTLLITGTVTPIQRALAAQGPSQTIGTDVLEAAPLARWIGRVQAQLAARGTAIAFVDGPVSRHRVVSEAIARALATLGASVVAAHRKVPFHLVIEGGATAAAVALAAGWHRLTVIGTWGGGVVSLRPDHHPHLTVSIKPGSYPWPPDLHALLFAPVLPSSS